MTPPQKDFFENAWRYLVAADLVRIYRVRIHGTTIGGAFVFTFRDSFQVWKVGWSGAYKEHYPNHFMNWELIKHAKECGFNFFEQVQILPDHARAIAKGEQPTGDYAGVTLFKMGFGGNILMSPPVMMKSYRPLVQAAFKAGGLRVLENRNVHKWVGKLVAKGA